MARGSEQLSQKSLTLSLTSARLHKSQFPERITCACKITQNTKRAAFVSKVRKSLLRWKWVFWPGRSACHVRIPVPHFAPSLAAFFAWPGNCAMRDESYWVLNLVPGPDPECSLCDKTGADCAPTILKPGCVSACVCMADDIIFRFRRQIDQLIGNYTRGHISFCGDAFGICICVLSAPARGSSHSA